MDFQLSRSRSRILLQLSNPKNAQMIRKYLSDDYEFIEENTDNNFESVNFDLCIINGPKFGKLKESILSIKERRSPAYVPVILLIKENRLKDFLKKDIGHAYDDLLSLPVSPEILESRIRSLLHQRHKSLELQEEVFLAHQAINSTEIGISIFDNSQEGNPLIYVNKGFEKLTGYGAEELLGQNYRFLQNDDHNQEGKKLREAINKRHHAEALLKNYKKDGTMFWNEVSISPIESNKKENEYFVSIHNDVSELVSIQHDLEELLEEKKVLLQEIHHRIKNNLAVIVALLELKIMDSDDEKSIATLKETRTRIFSISTVHELLYKQNQLNKIEFQDYIEELVSHLNNTYSQISQNLAFDLELESLLLSLDQAVPCGMLLSELITNIYKHAFDIDEKGKVKISIGEKDGYMTVLVKDNGKGLPNIKNSDNMENFSGSIIFTLLKQLDADWEAKSDDGFQLEFTFKLKNYAGIISEK